MKMKKLDVFYLPQKITLSIFLEKLHKRHEKFCESAS